MGTIPQGSLFSWKIVDQSSEILRVKRVLDVLPDQELIDTLRAERKGRRANDYPLEVVWNSVIAGVVCGHESMAALIRELRRNGELREVCGFDPLRGEDAVPPDYVYSRLFEKLFRHADLIDRMFERLVDKVAGLLKDFGVDLAIDGKALPTHGRKDPDAKWGVKTYKGKRTDGTAYEKVVKWFGYQLHLIVDANYELPVAFEVTAANVADTTQLIPLVERIQEQHPTVHARVQTMGGDRGYDDGADKAELFDEHGILPLIDTRDLHQEKAGGKMRPLDPHQHDTIYYSGTGEVCCKIDPFAVEEDKQYAAMQFMGFEKNRGTLKFRCPAAAFGIDCQNRAACRCWPRVRDGAWGRVVRVPLDRDRRLFLPVHRHSERFRKTYAKRTAVERVNSRIDQVYGFERHFIRGLKKMKLRVGLAMIVMLATAAAWVEAGQVDNVRSLMRAA
jgi:hypothetical protein